MFRASATPVLLTSLGAPVLLAASGLSPAWLVATLVDLGATYLAGWVLWALTAPVWLLLAALVVRRTPWPWTALVTVHLASLLVATLRVGHWSPLVAWGTMLIATVAGVLSVVAAVMRAEEFRTATGAGAGRSGSG